MAHDCGCRSGRAGTCGDGEVAADDIVRDVARRSLAAYRVLEEKGIDLCCGADLTLSEAAVASGVPLDALLEALRASRSAAPRPEELANLPASRQVRLDVREDIKRNEEPFARIMAAVKTLRADQALVLRAPFEPIPLYEVLGRRGLRHWAEPAAPGDWIVWFYRGVDRAADEPVTPEVGLPPAVLDVRGLEPPQPMVRVLEALERLRPDGRLEVLHDRRPMFLYPQLDERGFAHETEEPEPGLVRILIRRREAS